MNRKLGSMTAMTLWTKRIFARGSYRPRRTSLIMRKTDIRRTVLMSVFISLDNSKDSSSNH